MLKTRAACSPIETTFLLTENLNLLPGIQYILSQDFVSVKSTFFFFFNEFLAFVPVLDLAV